MPSGMRRGIAIAGLVSGRVAIALVASLTLHWGVWQAAGASPARAAAAPTVATLRWVPTAMPATEARSASVREGRPPAFAEDAIVSIAPMMPTVTVTGPSSSSRAARAPSRPSPTPAPSAPTYLEAWEVDVPAEFLVPPLALDELPEQVGEAVRAGVALRVDATGRLVDLEVSVAGDAGPALERLREALAAAFLQVAFIPAQRDGHSVPSVFRWQVGLDPAATAPRGLQLLN
jgi:hypothetical protein